MADIQFTETKGGWLARLDSFPRFMGAGDSQEAAERDLARVVAAFNRSLARAAQSATFAEAGATATGA